MTNRYVMVEGLFSHNYIDAREGENQRAGGGETAESRRQGGGSAVERQRQQLSVAVTHPQLLTQRGRRQ